MEKIKTYGLLFEDTEMATINRITNYIHNYIWAVSELFRDGVEHISENTYKKDWKVFRVNDENWWKYVKNPKRRKINLPLSEMTIWKQRKRIFTMVSF